MKTKEEMLKVLPVRLGITVLFTYSIVRLILLWKELVVNNHVIGGFAVLFITILFTIFTAMHFNRTIMSFFGEFGKVILAITYLILSYVIFRYGLALFVGFHFTWVTVMIVSSIALVTFCISFMFAGTFLEKLELATEE